MRTKYQKYICQRFKQFRTHWYCSSLSTLPAGISTTSIPRCFSTSLCKARASGRPNWYVFKERRLFERIGVSGIQRKSNFPGWQKMMVIDTPKNTLLPPKTAFLSALWRCCHLMRWTSIKQSRTKWTSNQTRRARQDLRTF